eukprot:3561254-Amphidinium_carterae.1
MEDKALAKHRDVDQGLKPFLVEKGKCSMVDLNGCPCVLEATAWWKTKRGKAFDTRCQECVRCVSTGWPFEDWYTLVARAKSNP